MARSLTLTPTSSRYVVGRNDGIRVRLTVTAAEDIDPKIFAYRMLPANPQTGAQVAFFDHVCSSVDLADYPEDAPLPNHLPTWFRLDYVDVLLRSRAEADSFIAKVHEDVLMLKRSLDLEDELTANADIIVGTPTPVDDSSDSSVPSTPSESSSSGGILQEARATATVVGQAGGGATWIHTGVLGAGSTIGESDSVSSDSAAAHVSRVTLEAGQSSKFLSLTGYDFGCIPPGARIEGVRATLYARAGGSGNDPDQLPIVQILQLITADGPVGENAISSNVELDQQADFAQIERGDDSDTWDAELTRDDVVSGNFGIGVLVSLPAGSPATDAEIDGCEITVYYRTR